MSDFCFSPAWFACKTTQPTVKPQKTTCTGNDRVSAALNVTIYIAFKSRNISWLKTQKNWRAEEASLWSHKHPPQLSSQAGCHTVNMIFSANVHRSITDEVEKWKVPEGILCVMLICSGIIYQQHVCAHLSRLQKCPVGFKRRGRERSSSYTPY